MLTLVRQCLQGRAPQYLCSKFTSNVALGYARTRGNTNLHLKRPATEFYLHFAHYVHNFAFPTTKRPPLFSLYLPCFLTTFHLPECVMLAYTCVCMYVFVCLYQDPQEDRQGAFICGDVDHVKFKWSQHRLQRCTDGSFNSEWCSKIVVHVHSTCLYNNYKF